MGAFFIPEEWELLDFENCISSDRFNVGKVKQRDYKSVGRFPVIDQGQNDIAGYWDREEDVYSGHLPVIIFGDHTRIFKYVDCPFVCGADGTKVFMPDTDKFNPKYLFFSLSILDIPSRGYNRHYPLLKQQKIPCPPLLEQENIATVLSVVQEAKEKTEGVIRATKELKKSLMKHLFTYGPVSVKEAERVTVKETEIGFVPEHWPIGTIADVEELVQYGTSDKCETYNEGFPVLRIPNVIDEVIKPDELKYLTCSSKEAERYLLQDGDLLFVRTNGAKDNIGRCAVYVGEPDKALFASYIIRVRLDTENVIPQFAQLFLQSQAGRTSIIGRASKAADGKYNINSQTVRGTPIPLPPIAEQEKILSVISTLTEKLQAEKSKKAALDTLFKTLLDHLMTGKIRVKEINLKAECRRPGHRPGAVSRLREAACTNDRGTRRLEEAAYKDNKKSEKAGGRKG
jgi:type I restriction enzyme S subunit